MDSINTVTQINEDSKREKSDDDQSTSSSQVVCGGCRKKLWSLLPVNYKEEIAGETGWTSGKCDYRFIKALWC